MQCYIYKSLKKADLYVYLDRKDDFSRLPEACFKLMGNLEYVMNLELTSERKLARENTDKVLKNLHEKGFFIQMPPMNLEPPTLLQ